MPGWGGSLNYTDLVGGGEVVVVCSHQAVFSAPQRTVVSQWGMGGRRNCSIDRSLGSLPVGGVGSQLWCFFVFLFFYWYLAAVKHYLNVFCLASLHLSWYFGQRQQAFLRICFVCVC